MQQTRYSATAKMFHWLIVALIVLEYSIVLIMPDLKGSDNPTSIVNIHMSVGVTILIVMFARLGWRLTHPISGDLSNSSWWQNIAARWTHILLYTLLTLMPIIGWVWASSRGWTVTLFNTVTLPALVSHGSSLGNVAGGLHSLISTAILALIAIHIGAAFYHRLILKDSILGRMLPKQFEKI